MSAKEQVNFRFPPGLKDELEARSRLEGYKSLTDFVVEALQDRLKADPRPVEDSRLASIEERLARIEQLALQTA